jgi:hypothetical protein
MDWTTTANSPHNVLHVQSHTNRAKGPGGRPKKEWSASLERRTIRLYLFTTLRTEDILRILGASGFNVR